MLTKTLQFLHDNEERVLYKSSQFPYFAGMDELSKYYGHCVPWHWHSDVEFAWVLQGRLLVKTNHKEEILTAGEGCFINSNYLHYYEALPGADCIYFCQVFDPSIVSGAPDSIFGMKYVQPVIYAGDLELFLLKPASSRQRKMLTLLRETQDLADLEEFGYELRIRSRLSEIWLMLFLEAESLLGKAGKSDSAELRIKLMMSYIHAHYAEKLTLEAIAASADVSVRECLRCFRSSLSKTPFQYLMEYRSHKAADLLSEQNLSITEIGEMSGFSSPSYFAKTFKKIMGVTPGDFRKNAHLQGSSTA